MGFLDFLIDIITPAPTGIIYNPPQISILDYWNEIVDWASESIKNKCIIFLRWVNGELIPKIKKLIGLEINEEEGERRPASEEDLYKLYDAGIITKPELEALLRGEEISTVIDPK